MITHKIPYSLYNKVKSITFEFLNNYGYGNFRRFVDSLWKSINYFREFHVLLSKNLELARDLPVSWKLGTEYLYPGQKGA